MICQRCLHRASTRAVLPKCSISPNQLKPPTNHPAPHRLTRTLTTSTHSNTPQPTTSSPSTSTAQFATPLTPTLPPTASTSTSSSAAKATPLSSVPAGTALRGLNYLKAGSEPLALEDDAYPAWLWRCLDSTGTKKGGADGGDGGGGAEGLEGDLFCSSSSSTSLFPYPPFPFPPPYSPSHETPFAWGRRQLTFPSATKSEIEKAATNRGEETAQTGGVEPGEFGAEGAGSGTECGFVGGGRDGGGGGEGGGGKEGGHEGVEGGEEEGD